MTDAFAPYETGLACLLERLGQDHPQYAEALTLEAQLRENVEQARLDGDTEGRRAERSRILRELNRLALQTVGVSFNELCGFPRDDVVDTARRASKTSGFVNRERELHLLKVERLRASRSPYTLISAPAGYGKSCLLQHLIQVVEADETLRHRWSVRYVEFDPQARDPIACVVYAVAGPSVQLEPGIATHLVGSAVVQELSAPLPEGRRAVLLIFDAVERLDEGSRQWLGALLNDLRRRTRLGDQEIITVRVVIAGRNVETFWDEYARAYPRPPAPQRLDLGPFDERPIQELIWNHARAAGIGDRLDDQNVVQIADEMRYLSGGHPQVIRNLLDDLARRSFAIGPVAEHFAQCREQMVRTVLSPVADNLLRSLETGVREAVQALSVFRQINANTVQVLAQQGLLPTETDAVDLLGDLQRARLLDPPDIRQPFYRDRWMRRILALDMAYRSQASRALFLRLNRAALGLYHNWIHDLGPALLDTHLKPAQRLLSVLEWLFHALQDEDIGDRALRSELQRHVGALSGGDERPSVADLIADEITRDAEVCYLLRHRLGDDGASKVCGWLHLRQGGTANGQI